MTHDCFQGKKILVVEDFDDTRLMLKRFLEGKGCVVVEGKDGQEAMEMAIREPPDLILMDLRMPVLDGLNATRLLRERKELDDVPVVAVTAYDTRGVDFCHNADLLGLGVIEYFPKPIEFAALEQLLTRLLRAQAREATG